MEKEGEKEGIAGQEGNDEQKPSKPARKKSLIRRILIGVAITLGVILLVVVGLILRLFSRVSRPEPITPAVTTAPPTPSPTIRQATPTPVPVQTEYEPTPTPLPTQEPSPLPLEEFYTQTYLTGEQLKKIEDDNADGRVINILLVGLDRRGTRGNYGSTDTIMIATLDKKNGRLKLTSLLRDLFVPIEGEKPWRINSIASGQGMHALINTVNSIMRLDIQNYVAVDFSMFEKIVNKLGGVTVRMSSAEISAANDNIAGLNKQRGVEYLWDGFIFAEAGNVGLNGKQALAYSRIRHLDSDFKRTNRQFKVLTAIFAEFRQKNLIEQYALIDELLPLVETDIPGLNIIDLGISALSMDTSGLLHFSVPAENTYKSGTVSGSYALLFDMPANAWLVHEFIYDTVDEPEQAQVLSPGKSLPPRTPSPTIPPEIDPNIYVAVKPSPEPETELPVIEPEPELEPEEGSEEESDEN